MIKTKAEQIARTGGEYDPISDCRPPGTPRWFTEPFLHEFIVTPAQTWLINEMVNDVRRVYTDGREHTSEDDAYPSWNGDTVGFWDGDTLVAHTTHLMPGQYQRGVQPNYSEQTSVVERWRKIDPKTLQADVWVFDPIHLAEPWYTRQGGCGTNDDHSCVSATGTVAKPEQRDHHHRLRHQSVPRLRLRADDAATSSDEAVRKRSNPLVTRAA